MSHCNLLLAMCLRNNIPVQSPWLSVVLLYILSDCAHLLFQCHNHTVYNVQSVVEPSFQLHFIPADINGGIVAFVFTA